MPNNNEQVDCKPASGGITTKEYFTLWLNNMKVLIDERTQRIDERFTAAEQVRCTEREAMDKRLDSMNEFRGQLRDQNNTFLTKDAHVAYMEKVESEVNRLEGEIRGLQDFKLTLDTKASTKQVMWANVISGISLFLVAVDIISRIIFR